MAAPTIRSLSWATPKKGNNTVSSDAAGVTSDTVFVFQALNWSDLVDMTVPSATGISDWSSPAIIKYKGSKAQMALAVWKGTLQSGGAKVITIPLPSSNGGINYGGVMTCDGAHLMDTSAVGGVSTTDVATLNYPSMAPGQTNSFLFILAGIIDYSGVTTAHLGTPAGMTKYTSPYGPDKDQETAVYLQALTSGAATGVRAITTNVGYTDGTAAAGFLITKTAAAVVNPPSVDAGADQNAQTVSTAFARTATESANGAAISSRFWRVAAGKTKAGKAAPGGKFDLSRLHWTLPTGSGTTPTQINMPDLAFYADDSFYLDETTNELVCTAPVQGITTSGASGATRSEGRGRNADGSLSSWGLNAPGGTRSLTVTETCDPTQTGDRQNCIVGQIHSASDTPVVLLDCDYSVATPRLRLYKDGPGVLNLLTGLTTGQKYTYRILVAQDPANANKWTVFVSACLGDATGLPAVLANEQWKAAYDTFVDGGAYTSGCYFKFGAYNKSTISGGATGFSRARISYFQMIAPDGTVTGGTPGGNGTALAAVAALNVTPNVLGTYTLRYLATNSAGTSSDDMNLIVTQVVVDPGAPVVPPPAPAPTGTTSGWSNEVSGSVSLRGAWIHAPGQEDNRLILPYGGVGRTQAIDRAKTALQFIGRKYPVYDVGDARAESIQITSQVIAEDGDTAAKGDRLRAIGRDADLVLFRDGRGRKMYAIPSDWSMTDLEMGGYEVSFLLSRVDYDESLPGI